MSKRIEGIAEQSERLREILCHIILTKLKTGEKQAVSSREIYACSFIDIEQDTVNTILDTLVALGEWIELKGRIYVPAPTRIIDLKYKSKAILISPERTDVLKTRYPAIRISVLPNGVRLVNINGTVQSNFKFQTYRTWIRFPVLLPRERFEGLIKRTAKRIQVDVKDTRFFSIVTTRGRARLSIRDVSKLETDARNIVCIQQLRFGVYHWFLGSFIKGKLYEHCAIPINFGRESIYGYAAVEERDIAVRLKQDKTLEFIAYPPEYIEHFLKVFTRKIDNCTYAVLTEAFIPMLKRVLADIEVKVTS